MYIKIKLEPRNENTNENKLKEPLYFEIGDESIILDVKLKIEKYIEVPAQYQEVRTILKTLRDNDKLTDIVDELSRRDGSTVMLYTYDIDHIDHHNQPSFFCFLQLHNAKEAAIQQDFDKKSKNPSYFKDCAPASVTSTITLVGDSDSENENISMSSASSEDSETSAESGTSMESACSDTASDGGTFSAGRKRRNGIKSKEISEKKQKRLTVLENPKMSSGYISTYLEEFPKYTEQNDNNTQPNSDFTPKLLNSTLHASLPHTSFTPPADRINSDLSSAKEIHPKTKSFTQQEQLPCAAILPELRAYIAILSCVDNAEQIDKTKCAELLALFVDVFRKNENSKDLQFHTSTGPVLYEGKMWLLCQDSRTLAWTLEQANAISTLHKAEKFIDFFKLMKCLVVIPRMTQNLCDVFTLIERQNTGIETKQWVVQERRVILDESDDLYRKCISSVCANEVLFLNVDQKSFDLLRDGNFKLKYCFWQITFEVNE